VSWWHAVKDSFLPLDVARILRVRLYNSYLASAHVMSAPIVRVGIISRLKDLQLLGLQPGADWRVVRYAIGMRYSDGGGLTAAERGRRQQVRLAGEADRGRGERREVAKRFRRGPRYGSEGWGQLGSDFLGVN
jgi:hypothetical protein